MSMISFDMQGSLVIRTDYGTDIFFYGTENQSSFFAVDDGVKAKSLEGKVEVQRRLGRIEVSSTEPIALSVEENEELDMAFVFQMTPDRFQRLLDYIGAQYAGDPDGGAAMLKRIDFVTSLIPNFFGDSEAQSKKAT